MHANSGGLATAPSETKKDRTVPNEKKTTINIIISFIYSNSLYFQYRFSFYKRNSHKIVNSLFLNFHLFLKKNFSLFLKQKYKQKLKPIKKKKEKKSQTCRIDVINLKTYIYNSYIYIYLYITISRIIAIKKEKTWKDKWIKFHLIYIFDLYY